ncbi:aspartate/glutamate racemase family protein [Sinirhodobacter huangdaonensis]|uniref:Hydantoin racemase n=1 Tax=Paenirhodobacter huangdaonensis TaxID=2501515 RepID=A0A443LZN9_9RHOB|nr:aspartate/glutamate racemase family protein [Sinirhodobacter huangdaonensis]RWR54715.1 hydantoin racemase [Sinirhodobacter huangdaonensis]
MKIAVLNPNSSTAVTASMEGCLAPLRAVTAHEITCYTLSEAPLGIETDDDVAQVAPMVVDFVRNTPADAYVIACFSDPGLAAARATTTKPIFGVAESAYCATLVLGESFGVISLGPSSIARHKAKIDALGLTSRLAGDRSIDMDVAEANDARHSRPTITRVAQDLLEKDKAEVLILGCAGMGEQRAGLQVGLGCIVIDPVQAAVSDAINALDLNYGKGA